MLTRPLPPPVGKKPPPVPPSAGGRTAKRKPKKFAVVPWTGEGEGEKIVLYGPSGRGKTTLAALAPKPVYIGLDDGGRKIRHPVTGEPLPHIEGCDSFDDVRDVCAQPEILDGYKTVVIDTGTILETLATEWTVQNIKHEKGQTVRRLVDYGYGKGYEHLYDTMRLAFSDFDGLVRRGLNLLLICQQCPITVANASGTDYLEDGPRLYHPGNSGKMTFSTRLFACEWADHVFKLDYQDKQVSEDKKATGSPDRAVFIVPEDPSYCAKSRTLGNLKDEAGDPITRIAFDHPADDSLWKYMFPEEK